MRNKLFDHLIAKWNQKYMHKSPSVFIEQATRVSTAKGFTKERKRTVKEKWLQTEKREWKWILSGISIGRELKWGLILRFSRCHCRLITWWAVLVIIESFLMFIFFSAEKLKINILKKWDIWICINGSYIMVLYTVKSYSILF